MKPYSLQLYEKIILHLIFLFPVVAFAQRPWYKYFPTDYMWMNVGNAGFSAGEIAYTSLAFNPVNSQPYVAYTDSSNSSKATAMQFDGTNWVNVGNAGFSAGQAWFTSLAFNSTGQPYVAYEDYGNSQKATVMMFNGTNWVNVGNAGFSDSTVWYTSLAFSPSGQPYLAYDDYGNSYKATVMRFNGTSWVDVGNAGFSAGEPWYISLAFSSSGQPYVAYQDEGNSYKATVMKYDSVYFGINELQESRLSLYPNPATDKIIIETTGKTQESYFVILNIEGQQVMTSQITQPKTQVDISSFPSGVYFVRVTNDNIVEVEKIIKK